jgi:hypothetical protein
MRIHTCDLFFAYLQISVAVSSASDSSKVDNQNHVFNAIHSSARQWGSSLNHNGMSLFLASVPAGTQIYHGTYTTGRVPGPEWLAFEPEHAMIFAFPRGRIERPEHPPVDDDDTGDNQDSHVPLLLLDEIRRGRQPPDEIYSDVVHAREERQAEEPFDEKQSSFLTSLRSSSRDDDALSQPSTVLPSHDGQQPFALHESRLDANTGYLHTYIPKHHLRLLYIDGLSAGKTRNGTLDTQDMLLLNMTDWKQKNPMDGEYERVRQLCNLSSTRWQGNIDGVIRMEAGFEIILCDFEKHLERIDITAVPTHERFNGFLGGWSYVKAITQRYDGIGGGRIRLDYDDFVSVFAYPDIDHLFENDSQSDYVMPRLQSVSAADRSRVNDDVTRMIVGKDWGEKTNTTDWQAVTDMVVSRYSKALHYLHTSAQIRKDRKLLQDYLTKLLLPFIDYPARNTTLEAHRCVSQLVPPMPTPASTASLAHRTIYGIVHHICSTLFTSLHAVSASTDDTISHTIKMIDNLVDYLQWTTWKKCGTCHDEEICYIPIWPMGNHEDHSNPRCRNEYEARNRWDYWGMFMFR